MTWLNKYKGYLTDEELEALPRVTTETGSTISDAVTEEMQGLLYMSLYLAQPDIRFPSNLNGKMNRETKVSVFTISFIIRDNRLIIFII